MDFHATLSLERDTRRALDEVCRAVEGHKPDLAIVFLSHHHVEESDGLLAGMAERINARNLIGCTGESIIGPDREIERAPAVSLWTARLPGVRMLPFYVDQEDVARFDDPEDWYDRLGVTPDDAPSFVMLPEPYSVDLGRCLSKLDEAFPGAVIVGGVASGANGPGQNRLYLNDQVLKKGLVGVSICGPVQISTVVSQGCRPVGRPFVITRSQENIIAELGGRPALSVLQEVFKTAEPADQALIQKGVMLGCVVDENLREFRQGDFLIRNVLGVVEESAIAVNEVLRPGQTVQFHVRDSKAASDEMKLLLSDRGREAVGRPAGGLLFSCNGRGRRMFGTPNHDIGLVNRQFEHCAVAGFFAGGEIGPVGSKTFVHGFTSSLILFSEAP